MRTFIDTCIVVYLVEGDVKVHAIALERFAEEREWVVSDLVRMECRVGPMRRGDAEMLARFERFFTSPRLRCVPLGRPIIDRATELRATSGMKPLDALHVATALETGCEAFWTNDLRLAGTKLAPRFEAALANAPTTT